MENLSTTFKTAIWNIFNRPTFVDFIDILLVAFIIYHLILIIKESRATALVIGIVLLLATTFLSYLFGLKSLSWLLRGVLSNGVIVLVILFKTEIRKIIEQLGLVAFKDIAKRNYDNTENFIIENIADACINLSKRRVGALIVFEQKMSINDVIQTGTFINSDISSQLIENIFEPNTPLHDGAVVVRGKRIIAASCILTLSQNNKISKELGTRHRAAIGISESSDAIALIVSEETGVISIAEKGVLERHLDRESLITFLRKIYIYKEINAVKSIFRAIFLKDNNNEE